MASFRIEMQAALREHLPAYLEDGARTWSEIRREVSKALSELAREANSPIATEPIPKDERPPRSTVHVRYLLAPGHSMELPAGHSMGRPTPYVSLRDTTTGSAAGGPPSAAAAPADSEDEIKQPRNPGRRFEISAAGKCDTCSLPLDVGEHGRKVKDKLGDWRYSHEHCPPPEVIESHLQRKCDAAAERADQARRYNLPVAREVLALDGMSDLGARWLLSCGHYHFGDADVGDKVDCARCSPAMQATPYEQTEEAANRRQRLQDYEASAAA
jgi:hypothetical protein